MRRISALSAHRSARTAPFSLDKVCARANPGRGLRMCPGRCCASRPPIVANPGPRRPRPGRWSQCCQPPRPPSRPSSARPVLGAPPPHVLAGRHNGLRARARACQAYRRPSRRGPDRGRGDSPDRGEPGPCIEFRGGRRYCSTRCGPRAHGACRRDARVVRGARGERQESKHEHVREQARVRGHLDAPCTGRAHEL
jgi:hypothetical protein